MKSQGDSKGASSSPRRRRPMSLKKWIALAVVVLGLLYMAVHSLVLAPLNEGSQVEQSKRGRVEKIIEDIGYFTGDRAIPNLDHDVSNLRLADLQKLHEVADSARQMVAAMQSGDFAKMRAAKADYETLARQNPLDCPNIFASFNALAARLGEIAQIETDLSSATVGGGDFEGFEKLQARGASLKSALGNEVPAEARLRLERVVHTKLAQGLLALLKGPPAPTRDYHWFESTWGKLKLGPNETESKAALDQVQRIAIDWQMVEAQPTDQPTTLLQARLKDETSTRVWPAWLREQAEAKIVAAQASNIDADEPGPRAIPPEPPRSRVPGGAPATSPLPWTFYLSDDNRFPLELPNRGEGFSFFLRTTGNADVELQPTGGVLARGLGPNGESFKSYGGRLITGKASPPTPFILVGKRADGGEAFQIYVGLGRLNKAIFGAVDGGLKLEGDKIVVDVSALPGAVSQPLWLRVPPGFGVKGSTITAIGVRAQRCNIAPVVKEIKSRIQKLSEPPSPPPVTEPAAPPGSSPAPPIDAAKPAATPPPPPAAQETEPAAKPETGKPSEADTASTTTATTDPSKTDPAAKPEAPKPSEKPKTASNAATPTAGARAAEESKSLAAHPLLNGRIPPGTYTLLVGDGDRKIPLIDFKIP